MRAVAAPAGGSVIGGKVEYWRAHGQEYDTVFLGTSHVLRAFVPAEFDRRQRAASVSRRGPSTSASRPCTSWSSATS